MDNIYCYPGTDILINKFNIKDKNTLMQAELVSTSLRLHQMNENPTTGNFDLIHLQKIHRFISQDIYEMTQASISSFTKEMGSMDNLIRKCLIW